MKNRRWQDGNWTVEQANAELRRLTPGWREEPVKWPGGGIRRIPPGPGSHGCNTTIGPKPFPEDYLPELVAKVCADYKMEVPVPDEESDD